MGTKYNVCHLRQIAVARLLHAIPVTLNGFDEYNIEADIADWEESMVTACITLANECKVPALLPFSLWIRTPETASQISELFGDASEVQSVVTEDGRRYCTDAATYRVCMEAGWYLMERRQENLSRAVEFECLDPSVPCRLQDFALYLSQCLRKNPRNLDNVWLLEAGVGRDWWFSTFDLCAECAGKAEELWEEGRVKTWDELPKFYGLAPWDELLAESKA
jgi:hypothetical protein